MHVPAVFAETNLAKLHDLMEQHSFALLITQVDGQPFATHLPILLERSSGQFGSLMGHMAAANAQWKQAAGQTSLAIFSGPHAYVSPTWYEAEQVVPTWNYVAVHAYGRIEIIDERNSLLEILRRSVQFYEQNLPRPWSFDDSSQFTERMLRQIVGFRIAIEKIEGKWKMNQNHPVERRKKVVRALRERGDENALGVAELMQAMLLPDSPAGQ